MRRFQLIAAVRALPAAGRQSVHRCSSAAGTDPATLPLKPSQLLVVKANGSVVLQLKLGCNQFYAALITLVNKPLQTHLNQAVRPEPAKQKTP